MLAERGHLVRGSDEGTYPPMSDYLKERGIEVRSPYAAANLDPALLEGEPGEGVELVRAV